MVALTVELTAASLVAMKVDWMADGMVDNWEWKLAAQKAVE